VEGVEWINEAVLRRSPIKIEVPERGGGGQLMTVELVPDGAFTIALASAKPKTHYLEVDRDTEHRSKLVSRIRGYLQYVGAKRVGVLWVVPDQHRAEELARWIQTEADQLKTRASIFAITTQSQVDERRILTGQIWQVVGVEGKRSLLPAVETEPKIETLGREPALA
jgi:hypothetical protein